MQQPENRIGLVLTTIIILYHDTVHNEHTSLLSNSH